MNLKPLRIEVPASSANLGPGFDCLGLTLDLTDTVHVEFEESSSEAVLCEITGDAAPDLDPRDNLICRGYRMWEECVSETLPGARFRLESRIPVGKGFGSSAASLVAGLAAAAAVTETPEERHQVLALAGRAEGHADNVGAAVLGGLVVAFLDGESVYAINVANHLTLGVALYLPDKLLLTAEARAALPRAVSMTDAVANVGRAGYLVTALMWGRWDLIGPAMEDRLHQPYRARLIPALDPVIAAARAAGAFGAALSGGGPSVLALAPRDRIADIAAAMEAAAHERDWAGKSVITNVREKGYTVERVEEESQ